MKITRNKIAEIIHSSVAYRGVPLDACKLAADELEKKFNITLRENFTCSYCEKIFESELKLFSHWCHEQM